MRGETEVTTLSAPVVVTFVLPFLGGDAVLVAPPGVLGVPPRIPQRAARTISYS